MKLQLIRNATMKLTYAGQTLLTDPMLSGKGALQSFAGIAPNPTVELPVPVEEVWRGVERVVVSHCHPDHFDPAGAASLPGGVPAYCQPGDEDKLAAAGLKNVFPIEDKTAWGEVSVTRTGGRHGRGQILERMGPVSGFVFQAAGEPVVYWAGDTVWCPEVENALASFQPDVIVTHSGGAALPGAGTIVMDDAQTLMVLRAAPRAVVVAVHMEALDHCGTSREALRQAANGQGIPASRLLIPADGEALSLP